LAWQFRRRIPRHDGAIRQPAGGYTLVLGQSGVEPLCPHGFFGIEPAVIDRTVTFMRTCMAEHPDRIPESVRSGLRRT